MICFLTEGKFISAVFANDPSDTFMDFFNSINGAKYDPYNDNFSNYPALACLIYKVFLNIIPGSMRTGDGFSLRNNQMAMIGFLLFLICTLWIMQILIRQKYKANEFSQNILFIVLLISAPFMFAFERGNIILLCFVFSMFFCFFFDSENKILKELSFLALAIAAAIKIYPAVLGLILIKRKNFKDAFRLAIYGIFVFVLPFFAYEGIHSLKIMIRALQYTSNLTEELGYGVNVSLYNILKTCSSILNIHITNIHINIIYILVFGILLFVLGPKTNYYYITIFFSIPFIEFMNFLCSTSSNPFEKKNGLTAIMFAIIFIPLPLGKVTLLSVDKKFFVSFSMLIQYLAIIWMVILIAFEIVPSFAKTGKYKKLSNMFLGIIGCCCTLTIILLAIFR